MPPKERWAMCREVSVVTAGGGVTTAGIYRAEARGAAGHPARHRAGPITKRLFWSKMSVVPKLRNSILAFPLPQLQAFCVHS